MVRHKWITGLRDTIERFYVECDSSMAVTGSKLTPKEREHLKYLLKKSIYYIDKRLPRVRLK
jgi:hypothetical protein